MNSTERKLPQKIALVLERLQDAINEIDGISQEGRTPDVDNKLRMAADMVFEAQETIKSIDLSPYNGGYDRYVHEKLQKETQVIFRHRKNKNV